MEEICELFLKVIAKIAELPEDFEVSESSKDQWIYLFNTFLFVESKKHLRDEGA